MCRLIKPCIVEEYYQRIVIYGNNNEKFFQYDYRLPFRTIPPIVELHFIQYHILTRHNRYEFNLISKSNGVCKAFTCISMLPSIICRYLLPFTGHRIRSSIAQNNHQIPSAFSFELLISFSIILSHSLEGSFNVKRG